MYSLVYLEAIAIHTALLTWHVEHNVSVNFIFLLNSMNFWMLLDFICVGLYVFNLENLFKLVLSNSISDELWLVIYRESASLG